MRAVFIACCAILISATIAAAAGMDTHGDVSQRARWAFDADEYPDYAAMIDAHQDAMQPGSCFPDWGYAFGFPNESEEAHWNPFIQFASEYIRANYPQPWDEATRKLVVFLLGITVHSVSDISWHGLAGVDPGLIDAMSDMEFGGAWGDAHSQADTGGEMVTSHSQTLDWVHGEWYVPSQDLEQIYHELGYTDVTQADLVNNMSVLYLASKAVKYFAWALFRTYAADSTFLVEQYQDYFKGGLDDMGIWTAWTWESVIDWIENGVPIAMAAMPPIAHDDGPLGHAFLHPYAQMGRDFLSENNLELRVEKRLRGYSVRLVGAEHLDLDPKPRSFEVSPTGRAYSAEGAITIHGSAPFSYLGKSVLARDLNGDGRDDLVIGAPGYGPEGMHERGMLAIVLGSEFGETASIDALTQADWVRLGDVEYSRFGWSAAVLDFNDDGVDDLAVSSPTLGSDELAYRGRVEVFFGTGAASLFSDEADVVIDGVELDTNLGWTLVAGDIDGDGKDDLLIGSPNAPGGGLQRGMVSIFLSSSARSSGQTFVPADADAQLVGDANFDWFGYRLAVEPIGGVPHLVVGAPTVQSPSLRSIGQITGWSSSAIFGDAPPVPAFTLTGSAQWEKVGFAFAFADFDGDGERSLFAAAPTGKGNPEEQAGRIYEVRESDLMGELTTNAAPVTLFARGNSPFGRFAFDLLAADFDNDGADDLVAGEPWRPFRDGFEGGGAYAWLGEGGAPFVREVGDADFTFRRDLTKSRFGSALAAPDFDGDGYRDFAIAAYNNNEAARQAGAVQILPAPRPTIAEIIPSQSVPFVVVQARANGRWFSLGLSDVRLVQGDASLPISDIEVDSDDTVRFTIDVPTDANGSWDLEVTTRFGDARLAGAFTIVGPSGDDDDDDDASDDDDSSADDDSSGDDDASGDDDGSGDDDDDGCGC
ncbi:MAG: integrin alpha [Deltaproteobacteria bacterium]|nr:integrin alpha [Deltaproteobacteria bacterium]